MARVAGINLPNQKRIDIALTYIFGIGRTLAKKILDATKINYSIRAKDLTETQIAALNSYIEDNFKVEGDLKREIQQNVKRYIDIGSYRGIRHRRNLPVHGQRSRTNARIRRGVRKTVGSVKATTKKTAPQSSQS